MTRRRTLRLKIVNDGTRAGTKIVDGQGRELEGVAGISWSFSHDKNEGVPRATIDLEGVAFEQRDDLAKHIL